MKTYSAYYHRTHDDWYQVNYSTYNTALQAVLAQYRTRDIFQVSIEPDSQCPTTLHIHPFINPNVNHPSYYEFSLIRVIEEDTSWKSFDENGELVYSVPNVYDNEAVQMYHARYYNY